MRPYSKNMLTICTSLVLVSACVTTGKQEKWMPSSGKTSKNIEQELAVDKSECMATAYRLFNHQPMPQEVCIGKCSGLAAGLRAGAASRQSKEVTHARNEYYKNCMIGRGWVPDAD